MVRIAPGEAVIICGLMGARKSAFCVDYYLSSEELKTITIIEGTENLPNNIFCEDLGWKLQSPDLDGRLVVWDEAGAYCARAGKDVIAQLCNWLATIRHRQISVIFVCQAPEQLDRRIMTLAAKTLSFVNMTQRTGLGQSTRISCYLGYAYTHELRDPRKLVKIWSKNYRPRAGVFGKFASVDFGDADRKHEVSWKLFAAVFFSFFCFVVVF